MNKTRFVVKAVAGTLATGVLLIGTLAAPAEAKKDTGWPMVTDGSSQSARDTGWPM